jgi:transmembrane sensor
MTDKGSDGSLGALAEAADWRVRLTEAGASSTPAFEAWLTAGPENRAAWSRMQAAWSKLDAAAALPEVSFGREARLKAAEGLRRRGVGTTRRRFAAAAGLAVALGGLGGYAWLSQQPQAYETAVGERRSVTLADGSVVLLDSASRVRVRYRDDARDLWLDRGQARFEVAKDRTRPFSVTAGDRVVVATGTAFDVELLKSRVQVTLLEGRVSVFSARVRDAADPDEAAPHDTLTPGERLITPLETAAARAPYAIGQRIRVSDEASAWSSGTLVFDNEPLPAVLERMNRYSERRLVAADAEAEAIRVSGAFKAGDVTTFLDALTAYFPVQTTSSNGQIEIRSVG